MKKSANKTVSHFFAITMGWIFFCTQVAGQGKVVINEFNESSACTGDAHYIELLNLGPGTQNISCYKIVTDTFTITIPNNAAAILEPGEIYLIAGTDTLKNCSASNPLAKVDLNWNSATSCPNCITPYAPLLDNFFIYGTTQNSHPLVLYTNNNAVVDAVREPGANLVTGTPRNYPIPTGSGCEASATPITLNPNAGAYELPQPNSPGAQSSYSRSSDASCIWVKSANKTTPGTSQGSQILQNTVVVAELLTNSIINNCGTANPTKNIDIKMTSFNNSKVAYNWSVAKAPTYATISSGSDSVRSSPDTLTLLNYTAGSYNMLIQPSSGCDDFPLSFVLKEPTLSFTQSITCYDSSANPDIAATAAFTLTNNYDTAYFPVSYTYQYSATNTFPSGSTTTGSDPSSPVVNITNLNKGYYQITMTPKFGCAKTISFEASYCSALPITLFSFTGKSNSESNEFDIEIDGDNELRKLELEGSITGNTFLKINSIPFENKKGKQIIKYTVSETQYKFYRLRIESIFGTVTYSPIVKIINSSEQLDIKVFPNPFQDYISLQHFTRNEDILIACLLSVNGAILKEENFKLTPGMNNHKLSTAGLSKGNYILSLKKISNPNIQFSNIIKQ